MIHLIYIYFIVNAFLAGSQDSLKYGILVFLFGIPLYIGVYLIEFFEFLIKKSLIRAWYRLYFTDYFANANDMFIKVRTAQYQGICKESKDNLNKYSKFFLRQIDKKYNYGITK